MSDRGADRLTRVDRSGIGSTSNLTPGQIIDGRYQIVSLLGQGGMGLVLRVFHVILKKEFALKTIHRQHLTEIATRRFQQEAKATFALNHPNIVSVNDFGVLSDNSPFLVMELITGESLGERLKRTGRLTLEDAIPIFVQTCFGLAYAHEHGLVHRDIKPTNIMLLNGLSPGTEGSVKIVDFGIAKFIDHEEGEIQALTRTGEIFGSPLYMSPEQCNGTKVDHRSDVYSLGCVMFEALTGAPPHEGQNALTTMMKHQTEPALTLKEASFGLEFPPALDAIIAKMLEKSPDDRYQNLGVAAHDLGALQRGVALAHTPSVTRSPKKVKSKHSTITMSRFNFYASIIGSIIIPLIIGYYLRSWMVEQNQNVNIKPHEKLEERVDNQIEKPGEITLPPKEPDVTAFYKLPEDKLKRLLLTPGVDKKFALQNTIMSEKAIDLIAGASWIRCLILRNCNIENKSLKKLEKLNLKEFTISGSNFDDQGAAGLSDCRSLEKIDATGTAITDKGVAYFSAMKSLKKLELSSTDITDGACSTLIKIKSLECLKLEHAKKLTNDGIAVLATSNVHQLFLADTNLDDRGLNSLASMKQLKTLAVGRTKITASGLERLLKANKLHELYICSGATISGQAIDKLRAEFPSVLFTVR